MPAGPATADDAPLLKIGFAETDITPEPGMEKPGGYGKAFVKTIQDPCKVRAAVFDDGTKRVALVGIDALVIRRQTTLAARKLIQQQCGIPPEAVLIGASHSHSSGPTGMILPGEYDHADDLVKELAYEKSSCADAKYLQRVVEQIAAAVCQANDKRVEAVCGVGSGHEDQVAFNRRFRMKNGLSFTHPGKRNPEIVKPAGPIDPEVGVVGSWDKDGNLLGCVVNYACHATCSAKGFSANWIYYLEQVIRGALGKDVVVVFLQGDCGDITQVDNLSPYPNVDGPIVGGRVGAEAVKVLLSMHRGAMGPLDARTKILDMGHRVPTPERVAACRELVKKGPKEVDATEWTFAKEIVLLDALLKKDVVEEVEVQAIQIGPAVFVTNQAEMFVEYGLELKEKSPFEYTFPVELANGCVGYVPTEEALGEHGGGYETRLTSYSNLEVAGGRKILDASIEMVNGMKPGNAPTPPETPPVTTPWSYGNVPPEVK
ncbi:MAG: hypothetical protein HUU20_21085 [Pirellulales bacterium]|nr:hypothetical protein [Pirellulales bacterium]